MENDSQQECLDSVLFTEDKTGTKDNENLFRIDIEGQQAGSDNYDTSEDEDKVSQINKLFQVDTSDDRKIFDNKNVVDDDDDEEEDIDDTDEDNHTVSGM